LRNDNEDFDYRETINTPLTPRDFVTFAMNEVKHISGTTKRGHGYYVALMRITSKNAPYDDRTGKKRIEKRTGIHFVEYDVCINNCFCYAAAPQLIVCPVCNQPRYDDVRRNRCSKKFRYIPVVHRLKLQYADPARGKMMIM